MLALSYLEVSCIVVIVHSTRETQCPQIHFSVEWSDASAVCLNVHMVVVTGRTGVMWESWSSFGASA